MVRATLPAVKGRVRPFAALPHDLVSDPRLKPIDLKLVAVLLRYAQAKATCWPSVATLGLDIGRAVRTVQYALKRLIGAGWLDSRPASNPTGRVLVLSWRVPADGTPPVQRPYSQGLPRVAPEAKNPPPGEERQGSALAGKGAEKPRAEPEKTPEEWADWYRACGWLDRPEGHLFRKLAEDQIERARLGLASDPVARPGHRPRTIPRPTGIVRPTSPP